jgi:hypothetical protein
MDTRTPQIPAWRRFAPRCSMAARALCLVSGLMSCAAIGFAQKTCIPPVRGVPGFVNPMPNWWNPNAPPPPPGQSNDYQPSLNPLAPQDPRWVGAASYDYGSGTLSDAEFLAESNVEGGQTFLYLSWYVKGGPLATLSETGTTLYVGFMPTASGSTGTIIAITLNKFTGTDPTNPDEPQEQGFSGGFYSPTVYQETGTSWPTPSPVPGWFTDLQATTGVWAFKLNPYNWAVEMRIPVDPTGANGISVGPLVSSPFSMWFALQPTATVSNGPAVITYTMPRGSNPIQYAVQVNPSTLGNLYPDPTNSSTPWASFAISDPASDTTCHTGVYLADNMIGTNNPVQSNISLSTTTPNMFFATPYNYSSTPVPDKTLTATYYLANWGSQVGDLIPGVSWAAPTELTSVPTSGLVGGIPGYSGMGTVPQGNITAPWTLTPAETCPFTGSIGVTDDTGTFVPANPYCAAHSLTAITQELHQCMMVKLNGPGVDFTRASAFHNMDFVGASTFSRKADISVAGLGAITAGATNRDVYLFVETLNMPKVVTKEWKDRFDNLVGAPGKRSLDVAKTTVSQLPYSELVPTVPIYIVRAYYDTGFTLQAKGGKQIVLQPETSFGYFVIPHGDVTGWVHSLQGATQIGPNWYRISVPTNGAAQVTTTIQALDGTSGGGTQPPAGKFAAFLDLGANFPQGTYSTLFNNGFSLNAGLEYMATSHFSAEGIFGYHDFSAKAGGSGNVYQFSADAKAYLLTGNLRPFINFGIGGYAFSPGSTHFGGNVGGGVLYTWSSRWGVQGSYNFHVVDTPISSTQFSTLQGGVRYVF